MQAYSEKVSPKANVWKIAKVARRFIISQAIAQLKRVLTESKKKEECSKESPKEDPAEYPPINVLVNKVNTSISSHHVHHGHQPSIRLTIIKNTLLKKNPKPERVQELTQTRAATLIQRFWKQYVFTQFLRKNSKKGEYQHGSFVEVDPNKTQKDSSGIGCIIV